MVEDQPVVEFQQLWFPTRASGERSFLMNLEFGLNQIPKGDELSVAEVAWSTGDVEEALLSLPTIVPEETRGRMKRLLQPWPEGRYTEAYNRSGGILNLFTPSWGEAQDEVWAGKVTDWEARSFPDDQTRQELLSALEQQWNTSPHPFFAGLTPAQVMVGGGVREQALAMEFLERIAEMLDGRPFQSEGEALTNVVLLLRGWECEPRRRGLTPRKIIVAERDKLLARRARVLKAATKSA
jgi:hypothetical protein